MSELGELKAKGELPKDNPELELYGACAKIGDGPTKSLIINTLIDCFIDIWKEYEIKIYINVL